MDDRSPVRTLALTWFQRTFSDLISVRAEITDFERALIEGTQEVLWLERSERKNMKEIIQTARASYHFIEQGSFKKPKDIAHAFLKTAFQVAPALNLAVHARRKAQAESNVDRQIEEYLGYYKKIYEGVASLVLAPIIYGFAITYHSKDKAFKPTDDGKIRLSALNKIEKWIIQPQKRLSIGINNHVRNAFSHEQYRLLDGGKVELWDNDPYKPSKSWGPEVWTIDDLEKACDELWFNSLGVILGLIIYSANNRKINEARGWTIPEQPHQMRHVEMEHSVRALARDMSFDAKNITKRDKAISMHLSTKLKGIDQEEEILYGGDGWSEGYKVPVKYVEIRLIEQVTGFLQKLINIISGIDRFQLEISSPDDEAIGKIEVSTDVLNSLRPHHESIDEARKSFDVDSVGNYIMYVRQEGSPRQF